MKAIITVVGPDRVGIIAEVCTLLAEMKISVVEISMNNSNWNIRSVMDEALVDGSTFVPLLIAMIVRFTAQPAG